MAHSPTTAVRSTAVAAALWLLPMAQHTPLSKWMAVPALTLQRVGRDDG
ncbi:MAG: hypothetical protein SVW77_03190 [Candidatus Nanohaloarchaea archaeon]|nr:hypothetical protein [Candidatus Nanohaloarchaea archaeon]